MAPFTPRDASISYTATLTDMSMSGNGTVVVTDGAGNQCQTPVSITVSQQVDGCSPAANLYFSDWALQPGGDARGEYTEGLERCRR